MTTTDNIIPIATTEELEKKWDRFSTIFQDYNEPLTTPFCNILISNLVLNPLDKSKIPKSIVEVACGAGAGSELCLFFKRPETKLTSTDLSSEMIQLAKKRNSVPLDKDTNQEKNFSIVKADAEHLPFPDSNFDRYFSNFCLHLVNDPDQMLKEAYRVLENGGIAAFSVWGRPENCTKFTITSDIAKELGIQSKQIQRGSFHLNNISTLREMGLKAGFKKILVGYTSCNDLSQSGREFVDSTFSSPELVDKSKTMDQELLGKWKKQIEDHVDTLYSQGKMVSFETAYMICTK